MVENLSRERELTAKEMARVEREVRNDYRNTFLTKAGRKVLTHMLVELHFFDTVSTEEEIALQNYAKNVLNRLGVLTAANVSRLTEALLNVPNVDTE